jgi:hypothetical protein
METRIETAGKPVEEVWTYEIVGDIMVANVEMHDARGRFVPVANCNLEFSIGSGKGIPEGDWEILGWGNGDPTFQYVERPFKTGAAASCPTGTPVPDPSAETVSIRTFNGCAQVILQKR